MGVVDADLTLEDHERRWNLDAVNARGALKLLTGDAEGTPDWNHVRIAHIDSGYTSHPVFGSWEGRNHGPFLPKLGKNTLDPKKTAKDPVKNVGMAAGHGTRTASVLTGDLKGSKLEKKYKTRVGVAPNVPVVPYRATNVNVLFTPYSVNRVAAALKDAIRDSKGVQVVSISLGNPFMASSTLGAAVDEAYKKGIIVVAAGGQIVSGVTYPGKFERTIGVGGITPKRKPWFHYETTMLDRIDVWAPADRIFRADTQLKADDKTLDYQFSNDGDGTSYATAHVAAAAAYWLEYNWDEIDHLYMQNEKHKWRRVEAFRKILRSKGRTLNWSGPFPGPSRRKPPRINTKILDIPAVMRAHLPSPQDLTKSKRLAVNEKL